MLRPIDGLATLPRVRLWIEGRSVSAVGGQPLAVALLEAGVHTFRETPVTGEPRGPLCLMGVCFDCLVQVDGQPNVQACMVTVREGMRVSLQHGAAQAERGA